MSEHASRGPAPAPAPPPPPGTPPPKRTGCFTFVLLFFLVGGAIIGAPFIVGLFLPERYEAHTRLRLTSSPEKVFDMVNDVQRNPMTGAMMQKIEKMVPDDAGRPRWREVLTGSEVTVTTLESTRPSRIRRGMVDSVVPMTSESEIEIAPAPDGGSIITAHSVTTIKGGAWQSPVFRFMMSIFSGAQTALEGYWLHLAKELNDKVAFEKPAGAPGAPTATATPAPR